MVIPCLYSFLLTVLHTPSAEPLVNKKRTRTLFHKESGSSTNCMVELTGVEPVSEKKAVRVSPGAVHLLRFPQCERVHTLDTLVAS